MMKLYNQVLEFLYQQCFGIYPLQLFYEMIVLLHL